MVPGGDWTIASECGDYKTQPNGRKVDLKVVSFVEHSDGGPSCLEGQAGERGAGRGARAQVGSGHVETIPDQKSTGI